MSILKIKNALNEWQPVTTLAIENGYFTDRTVSDDSWTASKAVDLHYSNFGNLLSVSSSLAISPYIDIRGAKLIEYSAMRTIDIGQIYYGTVLYDKDKNPLPGWGIASPHNRVTDQNGYTTQRLFVPETACWMRTTYWNPSVVSSNNWPTFRVSSIPIPDCDKPFTHDLPLNPDMIRVIKRARQLTDIKWIPRVDVSRYSLMDGTWTGTNGHFLDWFKANKEYKGAPYTGAGAPDVGLSSINTNYLSGQWGYIRFHLGLDVDFETFVTAARYPNSIMGTTASQSTAKFDSSPYGIFCSFLILYALGGYSKFSYPAGGYFYPSIESLGALSTFGTNNLRLADVLETQTHLIMVTDLIRDESGTVTWVEISEATTIGNGSNEADDGTAFGGVCRRKAFKASVLSSTYGAYNVKRMSDMNDIPYEQSTVVSVGNEPDCERIIDYACIPYLGNKAKYKVGYIPNTKILIGASGFTTLVVKKDGENFGSFTINGATEIEVGFSAAGSYSAYLQNSKGTTRACTWTVE